MAINCLKENIILYYSKVEMCLHFGFGVNYSKGEKVKTSQ